MNLSSFVEIKNIVLVACFRVSEVAKKCQKRMPEGFANTKFDELVYEVAITSTDKKKYVLLREIYDYALQSEKGYIDLSQPLDKILVRNFSQAKDVIECPNISFSRAEKSLGVRVEHLFEENQQIIGTKFRACFSEFNSEMAKNRFEKSKEDCAELLKN